MDNELIMYTLVNKDIDMSTGKVAGQVGHAVGRYVYKSCNSDLLKEYMGYEYEKKIVLKCKQNKLEELESQGYVTVRDFGSTEIEKDIITVVCLGLFEKDNVDKWVKRLRLY